LTHDAAARKLVGKPRRSWLFVPGADDKAHESAARSGADVLVQELEDFTPPALRPRARALAKSLYDRWRAAGAIAAVRVNPLESCGREDLVAVLAARPDIVMMSKVAVPGQVRALEQATGGAFDLVPNIETAAGLIRTFDIVRASPRVTAALMASEDMVADLGTSRSRGGEELAYARARFLVECRAAGVEAIDCPYTFSDARGAARDARYAKRLGCEEPGDAGARGSDQSCIHAASRGDRARQAHRRGLRQGSCGRARSRDGRRCVDRGPDPCRCAAADRIAEGMTNRC